MPLLSPALVQLLRLLGVGSLNLSGQGFVLVCQVQGLLSSLKHAPLQLIVSILQLLTALLEMTHHQLYPTHTILRIFYTLPVEDS